MVPIVQGGLFRARYSTWVTAHAAKYRCCYVHVLRDTLGPYLGLVDPCPRELLQFVYFIHGQLGEQLQKTNDISVIRVTPELSNVADG